MKAAALPALVGQRTFDLAQARLLKVDDLHWTDEQILRRIRWLWKTEGRITREQLRMSLIGLVCREYVSSRPHVRVQAAFGHYHPAFTLVQVFRASFSPLLTAERGWYKSCKLFAASLRKEADEHSTCQTQLLCHSSFQTSGRAAWLSPSKPMGTCFSFAGRRTYLGIA
jgi:hypothetical protein